LEIKIQPLVSIGVPVYNGEKTIERTLDALIAQDYSNVEIIISDNASTDATEEICKKYVQKDSRFSYNRAKKNFGAAWNFNKVLELSTADYFMWAADDDERDLSFVSACIEKLTQCPEAVVCQAYTASYIEGQQERLCVVHSNSLEGKTDLIDRYRETLTQYPVMSIYGLFRTSAIRKTHMLEKFLGTDIAFVLELSIYGQIVQVPRILFNYFGRKEWNTIDEDYFVNFFKKNKPWWYLPFAVLLYNHCKRVALSEIPFSKKIHLWTLLIEHEIKQTGLKILLKLCRRLSPYKWKEKLGCAIYWRWMHPVNIEVSCDHLYLERVIKPRLGWWN
jgi:glycosyltransferase involved in cell wall biosynthesis